MKTKVKSIFMNLFETLRENPLFLALVLSAVLNDFILRALTVGNVLKIKPVITSIAIILILGIVAILLAGKKRNYVYILFSAILSVFNMANYMYYTHYNSFISVNVLNQAKHLREMKNTINTTLNAKALLFLLPTLLVIHMYRRMKKRHYFENAKRESSIKREIMSPFIVGCTMLLGIAVTLSSTDISRLVKQWNREYLVEQFGIYTFAAADIVKSASVPKAKKVDIETFRPQMDALVARNQEKDIPNKYTGVLEGKDIYVIHYESVEQFAMHLAFGDGEVTPFLNKLSNESLFFKNFYTQQSIGTSSDSEFTFSTSLFPINKGTVFIDHADKEFETIQKLLVDKGYHTMSMHGNNGSFWNRNIMYPKIGYQEFLAKDKYDIDEEVGLGLSDMSFYRQSVEKIKKRKEEHKGPIMATLVSLSNHYPFDALDAYGKFDTEYLEGTKVSNYLKSMHYADKALASFFKQMDEAGLLDNAAVIIYGDHHAKISKSDYELIYNYDKETGTVRDKSDPNYKTINHAYLRQVRKTPLIIWTKDPALREKVDIFTGMIDVMPTLSNMLNIKKNPYVLGNDVFNLKDNTIIFPDGSFWTKDYYYTAADIAVYDMKHNELVLSEEELDKKKSKVLEESIKNTTSEGEKEQETATSGEEIGQEGENAIEVEEKKAEMQDGGEAVDHKKVPLSLKKAIYKDFLEKKDMVDGELDLSSTIIENDLIKKYEELLKKEESVKAETVKGEKAEGEQPSLQDTKEETPLEPAV